jgi:streptomycin 6-kinase
VTIVEPLASCPPHWRLEPDGDAFVTEFGSRIAPVRQDGRAAMLKIAAHPEERDGAAVMAWWDGDGAAKVLGHEGDALLMERAMGEGSLSAMAKDGRDFAATLILCRVAARLHTPRRQPPPQTLKPLPMWFRALEPTAAREGGLFAKSAAAARDLLASPQDVRVLHGDLHHDNVLDFGPGGWLAIDPKGLIGERGFDYANLFYNPWPTAADPGRLKKRLALVVEASGLEPARLLQWIIAYGGLSAAWTLESGMPDGGPGRALKIVEIAAALV